MWPCLLYTSVSTGKANGLYAEEFSMGTSSGGRNMPYIIVAQDKSAVTDWLDFTEMAETDPDKALKMIDSGQAEDIKVPVMYSNIPVSYTHLDVYKRQM